MNTMRILSIDPSICRIGIAVTKDGTYIESRTFNIEGGDDIIKRLSEITVRIAGIDGDYDVVLIEMPGQQMRMGDYAIKNVRSIQLLMMAIGAIAATLLWRYKVEFVPVQAWKKTKGKTPTKMIAYSRAGRALNEHESDALVMALNWERSMMLKGRIR